MSRVSMAMVAAVVAGFVSAAAPPSDPPASSPRPAAVILGAHAPSAIPGSYIVKLKDGGAAGVARELAGRYGGALGHTWRGAFNGFSVSMSQADATRLAADPAVAYVEQDQRWSVDGTQIIPPDPPANWGLDRIDQRGKTLDGKYNYDDSAGAGVDVYVFDTGIFTGNNDFGGRADVGVDEVGDGLNGQDCTGHGTAVAGIIGSTRFGVAKAVHLISVRVIPCDKNGTGKMALDGMDWVYNRVVDPNTHKAKSPSIIQFSISPRCNGTCPSELQALNDAVKKAIDAGIPVVASAGNVNADACTANAVAATLEAITVGATTESDTRWVDPTKGEGSNFGPCVDIWAPGDSIDSDFLTNQTVSTNFGTSFAAPMVTGAVALLMSTPQFAHASPDDIEKYLRDTATKDALDPSTLGTGSANLLLYTRAALPSNGPAIALAVQKDGRLGLFGVNNDGYIFYRNQPTPGSPGWGDWMHTASKGFFSVAAVTGGTDRIALAGLPPIGQIPAAAIWQRHQLVPSTGPITDGQNWQEWRSVPGLATDVAMAVNADGRIQMFDIEQAQLQTRVENSAVLGGWGARQPVAAPPQVTFRFVTAALGAGGLIEVAALDTKGQVWTSQQTQRNVAAFAPFTLLQSNPAAVSEIAMARNNDGKLLIVAVDGIGGFYARFELGPGTNTWGPWGIYGPNPTLDHITAQANAAPDNRIVVVASDRSGKIYQSIQGADTVSFSTWTQIDGQFRP